MPDGRIDVHYSIKRPLRHDGKTIGVIGNSINITHLKKVEQNLSATARLEHAELSKETFLKNIEHDLKTPSSIIALSTQRLRVCQDSKKKGHYLIILIFHRNKSWITLLSSLIFRLNGRAVCIGRMMSASRT